MPPLVRWSGALALAWGLGWGIAAAADPDAADRLSAVRLDLESARSDAARLAETAATLDEKVRLLSQDLVALAAEERRQEEQVAGNRARLADLTAQESAKSAALAAERATLAVTLDALLRIARNPPEGLIAMPVSVSEVYLTGRLIGGLVPALEDRAAAVGRDLEALNQLRASVAGEQVALERALQVLAGQRAEIAALVAETGRLRAETGRQRAAKTEEIAALTLEAANLEELIAEADRLAEAASLTQSDGDAGVELVAAAESLADYEGNPDVVVIRGIPVPGTKPEPNPSALADIAPAAGGESASSEAAVVALATPDQGAGPSFSAAKGILPMPAAGTIVAGFGDRRGDGSIIKGLMLETMPEAQVLAPFDGEIVYAGPFQNYGLLLIIAHGEDYHSVLAGFARIYATVGQRVLAGEPVGVLGGQGAGKAALYVELRHDGEPIDPMPWLSQNSDKDEG